LERAVLVAPVQVQLTILVYPAQIQHFLRLRLQVVDLVVDIISQVDRVGLGEDRAVVPIPEGAVPEILHRQHQVKATPEEHSQFSMVQDLEAVEPVQ